MHYYSHFLMLDSRRLRYVQHLMHIYTRVRLYEHTPRRINTQDQKQVNFTRV